MKSIYIFISILVTILTLSCKEKKEIINSNSNKEMVSTVGYFDTLEAKSGYGINGYWVQLTVEQFNKYKGKKVEVKGKLLIVEAVDEKAEIKSQGASYDQKFIVDPEIKIVQ